MHKVIEFGWTIEFASVKGCVIAVQDTSNSLHFWVIDVSIHCKTMTDFLLLTENIGDASTKTINWELLVVIIVFKNLTNTLDGLEILIFLRVPVVQRCRVHNLPVRECKINSNLHSNFAPT